MGEFYSFPRAKEDALFYSETLYFEEVGDDIGMWRLGAARAQAREGVLNRKHGEV